MGIDRYEDVWTAVLERSLNENGTASEVMNFGVSGYNAQQKVQTLLRKALQFNPELVIFQYTLTDGKDPYFYLLLPLLEAARRTSNSARTPIADALSLRVLRIGGHSALVRALLGLWIKYRPSAPAEMQNEFAFERYKTGDTRRSASGQFAELARRHGFNPAALIFPVFPPHHTSADYPFWPAHGEARAIFDEQQIPVLDLYDVLIECRERHQRPVHQELFHANELGNRCVGEAVALWVRELLDQPDSGLRAKPLLSLRQARAPNDS